MIKNVVVILFLFNLVACNPAQKASQNKSASKVAPFSCLSSQNQCDVTTDLGVFTVEFSGQTEQGKVKTELPFHIQLTFNASMKDSQIKSVNSYLEGKSMFMGKIPVFFEQGEKNSNVMRAETLLVNCSEEIMTWRQWFAVEVDQGGEVVTQDFFIDFDSKRL